MKRSIAILLFTVYAFGATDLHQVLRLPLLVRHYQKHRQELPSLSLSRFLKIHYIDAQPFDKDYAEDMRLPFKAPDHCISVVTVLSGPVLLYLPPTEKIVNTYTVVEEDILPFLIIRSIFQPPRISLLHV